MSHTLGIRSDERALVVDAKRRPVILLSKAAATWSDGHRRNDDCYLVAPVYSFSGDETRASYSAPFIDRVKGYMYWQLFYLPPKLKPRWNLHLWGDGDRLMCRSDAHTRVTEGRGSTAACPVPYAHLTLVSV